MGVGENEEDVSVKGKLLGFRHVVVMMMFLATTTGYACRICMSMAIVAMTQKTDKHGYMVFDWERSIQDTILSSFFWGYVVLQIPAGMVAARFGGKWLVFIAIFSNGLINMIVPISAERGGWGAMCACRVLMGLTQGFLYPSLHGIISQWVPLNERSRTGSFIFAGSLFGTVVEMMIAGVLSDSKFGWPSVFYSAGAACIVWSLLWIVLGASSPAQSRWLSVSEKKYIETNCTSISISEQNLPTPWKKICMSLPFWAILLSHSGQSLGYWTLLTEMPSYMNHILGVNIKQNGMLSSVPYITMFVLSFFFSWSADFIVNKGYVSLATSRRIFNTIALWGPAAALLGLCYMPSSNVSLAVLLLSVTVGLNGAHYVGFMLGHLDLAPNFASTMMGITNGIGNIFSILAPLSVTLVVKDENSADEWRKVFFISVTCYFLTNLFYLLFMSADVQTWNYAKVDPNIEELERKTIKEMNRKKSSEEKF